ncbi:MAG: sodium-translocating pyrophosphatase [Desulfurococcaceae archaeon]|nr:sodium-translocating pyrophosphatase [Desulfurococcaceae archaeon]
MGILNVSIYLGLVAGAVAILWVLALSLSIKRSPIFRETENEKRAVEIHSYIRSAAKAYIGAQYRVILTVIAVVGILIIVTGFVLSNFLLMLTGILYIVGGLSSATVSIVGMLMAIETNIRVLNTLTRRSLRDALSLAFRGGSVTGFLVGGIGLFFISLLYLLLSTYLGYVDAAKVLLGYAFGASTAALFARVGGGIYTKAADVGADLVGKVEVGIPEDDPRNPGVIADNVGDNVGDCAGMGADLFESYVEAIVAPMVIGAILGAVTNNTDLIAYPLLFSALALITSLIAAQFVSISPLKEPSRTLTATSILSITLAIIVNGVLTSLWAPNLLAAWGVGVLGLIIGAIVGFTSDYFTSPLYKPVKAVAFSSQFGPALTILSGMSMGLYSVFIPSAAIALGVIASYILGVQLLASQPLLAGMYAAALAGTGMLGVTPIVVSADAYGPVVDNTAGLAEQAGYEESVRDLADKLDSAGNTMKSISKGYAIGSAALTALGLVFSYVSVIHDITKKSIEETVSMLFNIGHPTYGVYFLGGLIIGAVAVALFVAMVIQATTAAAGKMVEEIRRQFKERPGILEWKEKPDYERCVRIVTYYALRRLIAPGVLALLLPLVLGIGIGKGSGNPWTGAALIGGLLIGSIASGLLLGLFQGNVGNTWDNAKKYIESGNLGGKGSEAHKAAVVGDTVGDPLKDASGPAINIMIKAMAVTSSVLLPYLLFL